VVALPVTLLAGAVGNVFYAQAAPLAREDSSALRNLFVRTTRSLGLVTILPTILFVVLAPLLFRIVFGADWVQAGIFAAVMAPWYGVVLVTNPTGGTLDVLERQDLHLWRELMRLVIIGAAPIIAYHVGLPPVGVVASVSLAGCATYLIYGWLSWRAIVTRRPPLPRSDVAPPAPL
jgi:lipopolysaccharide exporter